MNNEERRASAPPHGVCLASALRIQDFLRRRLDTLDSIDGSWGDPEGPRHYMIRGMSGRQRHTYRNDVTREVRFLQIALVSLTRDAKVWAAPRYRNSARVIWKLLRDVIEQDTLSKTVSTTELTRRGEARQLFYHALEVLDTDVKEFIKVAAIAQRSILRQDDHPFDSVLRLLLPTDEDIAYRPPVCVRDLPNDENQDIDCLLPLGEEPEGRLNGGTSQICLDIVPTPPGEVTVARRQCQKGPVRQYRQALSRW